MRSRSLAAILVVPLFLAAACGGDPEPIQADPSPRSSSSASPSTSATPEPQSPEDFVEDWIAAVNVMLSTGESGQFRELSESCKNCQGWADLVARIYSDGGYIKGGEWDLEGIEKVEDPNTASPFVTAMVIEADSTQRASKSSPVQEVPGTRMRMHIVLKSTDEGLVVRNYTFRPL